MKRFKLRTYIDEKGEYHVINECDGGVPAGTIPITPTNSVGSGAIANIDKPLGKKKVLKRKSIIMDNNQENQK